MEPEKLMDDRLHDVFFGAPPQPGGQWLDNDGAGFLAWAENDEMDFSFDRYLESVDWVTDVVINDCPKSPVLTISDDRDEIPGPESPRNAMSPMTRSRKRRRMGKKISHLKPHPQRFTVEQRLQLRAWVQAHVQIPYVESSTLKELCQATGLSEKQIQTHFNNYRRRKMLKIQPGAPPSRHTTFVGAQRLKSEPDFTSMASGNLRGEKETVGTHDSGTGMRVASIDVVPTSKRGHSPSSDVGHGLTFEDGDSDVSPWVLTGKIAPSFSIYKGSLLDWYLDTLASEHAELCSVAQNEAQTVMEVVLPADEIGCSDPVTGKPADDTSRRRDVSEEVVCASQEKVGAPISPSSKVDGGRSEAGSAGNIVSSCSSYASFGPRKGRRAYATHKPLASDRANKYACQYCGANFGTKYLRTRHENSMHNPKQAWRCNPVSRGEAQGLCPLCLMRAKDCQHQMLACWSQSDADRTFFRKDGLAQHMKGVHGGQLDKAVLDELECKNFAPAGQISSQTPFVEVGVRRRGSPPRNSAGEMICDREECIIKQPPEIFKRRCEWSKHMDRHERPYKCHEPGCELNPGFTYSGGLLRHQREVHKMHLGAGKRLNCPYRGCKRATGLGFTRRENLTEHIRRLHRDQSSHSSQKSTDDDKAAESLPTGRNVEMQASLSNLREENAMLREKVRVLEMLSAHPPATAPHSSEGRKEILVRT